jgi:hypothetical protein
MKSMKKDILQTPSYTTPLDIISTAFNKLNLHYLPEVNRDPVSRETLIDTSKRFLVTVNVEEVK